MTGAALGMKTWLEYDNIREVRNGLVHKYAETMMHQTHEREYRYEERGTAYSLKCWHNGIETSQRGEIHSRPDWLVRVIDTATVGGHLKRIAQPPPDAIVWFTTDLDNTLKSFLELT